VTLSLKQNSWYSASQVIQIKIHILGKSCYSNHNVQNVAQIHEEPDTPQLIFITTYLHIYIYIIVMYLLCILPNSNNNNKIYTEQNKNYIISQSTYFKVVCLDTQIWYCDITMTTRPHNVCKSGRTTHKLYLIPSTSKISIKSHTYSKMVLLLKTGVHLFNTRFHILISKFPVNAFTQQKYQRRKCFLISNMQDSQFK